MSNDKKIISELIKNLEICIKNINIKAKVKFENHNSIKIYTEETKLSYYIINNFRHLTRLKFHINDSITIVNNFLCLEFLIIELIDRKEE